MQSVLVRYSYHSALVPERTTSTVLSHPYKILIQYLTHVSDLLAVNPSTEHLLYN